MSNKGYQRVKDITSGTMVPLSFIAVLACGILWLTTMHANLSHASSELIEIKNELKDVIESRQLYRVNLWESQMSIDKRLSQIEGKIDILVLQFEKLP